MFSYYDTLRKPGANFANIFRATFAPIVMCQRCTNLNVITKKMCTKLSNEKAGCKMLVKLDPIVNFTNILRAAFVPKSTKLKCKFKKAVHETFA